MLSSKATVLIICFSGLALITSCLFAQRGLHLGLKIQPGLSAVKNATWEDSLITLKTTFTLGAGLIIRYQMTNLAGIQGEVLYSKQGQRYEIKDSSGNPVSQNATRLTYLTVPVLLRLSTPSDGMFGIEIHGGPQIGILLGAELKTETTQNSTTTSISKVTRPVDAALTYGGGVFLGLTQSLILHAGIRYVYGIVDIGKAEEFQTKADAYISTYNASTNIYIGVVF